MQIAVTQPLMTRTEALQRRDLRRAWILLALGLIVPFLALWAAFPTLATLYIVWAGLGVCMATRMVDPEE